MKYSLFDFRPKNKSEPSETGKSEKFEIEFFLIVWF